MAFQFSPNFCFPWGNYMTQLTGHQPSQSRFAGSEERSAWDPFCLVLELLSWCRGAGCDIQSAPVSSLRNQNGDSHK